MSKRDFFPFQLQLKQTNQKQPSYKPWVRIVCWQDEVAHTQERAHLVRFRKKDKVSSFYVLPLSCYPFPSQDGLREEGEDRISVHQGASIGSLPCSGAQASAVKTQEALQSGTGRPYVQHNI